MADDYIKGVPLADLPETTSAGDNDIMVIQNTTKTQKIKWSTIFSLIKQKLGLATVATSGKYSDLSGTPSTLKNPHSLKFTGGVTDSYDGSQEKSVAIQTPTGDTKDNVATFSSGDALNPDKWTDFNVMASKEDHATLLNKISVVAKNARYLFKILGSTDISEISGGTVTGAISNFAKARNGINVSDWNNAVESGIYCSARNASNVPISIGTSGEQFYGSVTAYNGAVIQEVYTTAPRVSEGGGTPAKWIRFKYAGQSWQAWQNDTVADRLLKSNVANNLTTDNAAYALAAPMGKKLQGEIDELNARIRYANIPIGDVTIQGTNYYKATTIDRPIGYVPISCMVTQWSNNTNSFSVTVINENELYIIAPSGTKITGLYCRVTFLALASEIN